MEWNMEESFSMEWNMEENFSMEYGMEDFWYGMKENCQYGIWKNRLPFHSIPCPGGKSHISPLTKISNKKNTTIFALLFR